MAANVEVGAAPRRPLLVWLIFVFYVLITAFFVASLLLSPARLSADPAVHYSWVDYAESSVLVVLKLSAAILLFRLRRSAAWLFTGILGLNVVLTGIDFGAARISEEYPSFLTPASVAIGFCFIGGVCLYSWHLARCGVLRGAA